MKTVQSNPPVQGKPEAEKSPELIKDQKKPSPKGKGIGELVGGESAASSSRNVYSKQHEEYWRQNHPTQKFADGRAYDDFYHAYRSGYEGYAEFGRRGKTFEETETKLRERYETEDGSPKLPWTTVRPASHAAWHRYAGQRPRNES